MKCQMTWNVKLHEMTHDTWWWQYIYCWTFIIFMLMLMLDLWPPAETPGVTHFGAYHRPPDGNFYNIVGNKLYDSIFFKGTTCDKYPPSQKLPWRSDLQKSARALKSQAKKANSDNTDIQLGINQLWNKADNGGASKRTSSNTTSNMQEHCTLFCV